MEPTSNWCCYLGHLHGDGFKPIGRDPWNDAVRRCAVCGHGYQQHPPERETLDKLYGDYAHTRGETPGAGKGVMGRFHWDLTVARKRVQFLLPQVDIPKGRWLDIGGGNGAMREALADHSVICDLCEYGGSWVASDGDDEDENTPLYEVVSFFDSLEHVHNPLGLLRAAIGTDVHTLIIELPDYETADSAAWRHYKTDEHLHHFTEKSLRLAVDSVFAPTDTIVYRPVETKLGMIAVKG